MGFCQVKTSTTNPGSQNPKPAKAMKTKLTLLLAALTFAGVTTTFAGPSDSIEFALRAARERAKAAAPAVVVPKAPVARKAKCCAMHTEGVKYLPATNGKGGLAAVALPGGNCKMPCHA